MKATSQVDHTHTEQNTVSYSEFMNEFQANFRAVTLEGTRPLFRAVLIGGAVLSEIYLQSFPENIRQFHNCAACKSFIRRFGTLVVIEPDGSIKSALWNPEVIPEFTQDGSYIAEAFKRMRQAVEAPNRVDQQFFTKETCLGNGHVDEWAHLHLKVSPLDVFSVPTRENPGKFIGKSSEKVRSVRHALSAWSLSHIDTAVTLLDQEALNQHQKFLGPVKWLKSLKENETLKNKRSVKNLLGLAVATAPEGFCHPRAGMIGTLMDAIRAGQKLPEIQRSWNAKVLPERYMRPQALPSGGTKIQAKRLVEQMGIESAFARRHATVSELSYVWRPQSMIDELDGQSQTGSIFDSVQTKTSKRQMVTASDLQQLQATPVRSMTWVKFLKDVLPETQEILVDVPSRHGSYIGFTAPVHSDAKPILKWDRDDLRNPIAWYMITQPTYAENWGLRAGLQPIYGLCYNPFQFNDVNDHSHFGMGVNVVFEAAPTTGINVGMCLFPECLREELHEVRSVVEAYSGSNNLQGGDRDHASGLRLGAGSQWNKDILLVVKSNGTTRLIHIDRWE